MYPIHSQIQCTTFHSSISLRSAFNIMLLSTPKWYKWSRCLIHNCVCNCLLSVDVTCSNWSFLLDLVTLILCNLQNYGGLLHDICFKSFSLSSSWLTNLFSVPFSETSSICILPFVLHTHTKQQVKYIDTYYFNIIKTAAHHGQYTVCSLTDAAKLTIYILVCYTVWQTREVPFGKSTRSLSPHCDSFVTIIVKTDVNTD